jgi:hypothetical protein
MMIECFPAKQSEPKLFLQNELNQTHLKERGSRKEPEVAM